MPIKWKLVTAMALTGVIAVVLMGLVLFFGGMYHLRAFAVRETAALAEIIGGNCAGAMAARDAKAAQAELAAIAGRTTVEDACLYTTDGRLLARHGRHGLPPRPQLPVRENGELFTGDHLELCRSIQGAGGPAGTVYLRADTQIMWVRFKNFVCGGVLVTGVSMLVALLFATWLQRRLSGPILELARVARGIADRRDFSQRAVKTGDDEIGKLTDAFNKLLSIIDRHDNSSRLLQSRLEKRVQERTAELQQLAATLEQRADERARELARADEALRQSERRFQRIAAHIEDVLYSMDMRTREFRYLSPAFEKMFGYTQEDIRNMGGRSAFLSRVVYRGDADVEKRRLEQSKSRRLEGTAVRSEEWWRCKDGALKCVEDRWTPVYEAGVLVTIEGMLSDITERKRLERQMQRLASFPQHNPNPILEASPAGEITFCNPAGAEALKQMGLEDARAFIPRNWSEIVKTLGRGRREPVYCEVSIKDRVFEEGICFTPGADTVRIYTREITKRKRAEEALRASEARYRLLHESMTDAFVRVSMDGWIQETNRAFQEMMGYTDEELHRFTYVDVTPEQWHAFQARIIETQVLRRGFSDVYQKEYRRKDGTVFPIELRTFLLRDEQGCPAGMWAVVRDITERKQAEAAVLEHQQRLRALGAELAAAEQRERRRIAALLHDEVIQSLALTRIQLGGVAQCRRPVDCAQAVDESRKIIGQAIDNLRSLTYQLSPPILHELGLEAALDWLTEQFAGQYGIQCRFEEDKQPKPVDENVRTLLFAGVRELLLNVTKHAQAARAVVRVQKEDGTIRITVEDDGAGFDTAQAVRADKSGGFGLFNLRERLSYLGGRCEIQSEQGRGTKVVLIAPLKQA
ncbi:MAG: PAS domain S-box protein [Verrucomicrobia bacterium]|nr:PAS domain S-box protein [Verrucomicrobiota bacterium]